MSGANSRARRVEAVKAAEAFAYGHIKAMPEHFDERQDRIFNKYIGQFANRKSFYDELDNDMWVAYTGMTQTEYMEKQK